LEDGKEINAVMLVGRLSHARATVTRCVRVFEVDCLRR